MSVPWYPTSQNEWRDVAHNAALALAKDHNDHEAMAVLTEARTQMAQAGQAANLADQQAATQTSPAVSAAMGASQGATFGMGDEVAGLVNAIPGILRGGNVRHQYLAARDANRAFDAQAAASHPGYHFGGDIGAGLLSGGLLAGGVARAVPALPTAIRAGGDVAATLATKARAGLAGGTLAAIPAVLQGYGSGEGGPIADLVPAGQAGLAGLLTGGLLTVGANRLVRRSAAEALRGQKLQNEAAASALSVPQREASVAANQARARTMSVGADVAEQTAPARVGIAKERWELMRMATPRPIQGQMGPLQAAAETGTGSRPMMGAGGIRLDTPEAQAAIARARAQLSGGAPEALPAVLQSPVQAPMPPVMQAPTMPGSPREAARAAYHLAEAASPGSGTAAARQAAGMASQAVPTPPDVSLLAKVTPQIQQLITKPVTPLAMERLMNWAATLTPAEQNAVLQRLPEHWLAALRP